MMRKNRKIAICILLLMLSIDNIYFLNYKIAGLDIIDIGILASFAILSRLGTKKIRISNYSLVMFGFCIFTVLISLARGFQVRYILADARNFVFMVIAYGIFKNMKSDNQFILNVLPYFGLINCLIFLSTSDFFAGLYTREIYTPLWIAVFAVACILYTDSKIQNLFKYGILLVCVASIAISETRSYIIPIIILFILYGISAIWDRQFLRIIILSAVIFISIDFLRNEGYYAIFLNRMSGSFESDSTMWLRFENSINQLKNMKLLDWFIGRGMGERFMVIQYDRSLRESSDLEMFFFNQISEWGLPVFLFNYIIYIRNMIRNDFMKQSKGLLVGAIVILIGGFISGLVGTVGSVVIGMLFGMLASPQNEIVSHTSKTNRMLVRSLF